MPTKSAFSRPLRISHVISGLNVGGAETMLTRLVEWTDREKFLPEVISLTDAGALSGRIMASGIPVHALGMRRGVPDPAGILRLAQRFRQNPPDIVQTWLYHGDLIGGLAARLAGIKNIFWCIQNSDLSVQGSRRTTIATAKLCARLSRSVPQKIVCVSERAKAIHVSLGYDASRFVLIPNGADTDLFHPNAEARAQCRTEWGIPETTPVIGMAARYDPQKDYPTFLAAAALLKADHPEVRFVLCGSGVTSENAELVGAIRSAGLMGHVLTLGVRSDTPRVFSAFDIATLCSRFGEAFSLYLGEAMACGTPVVATDVGDSAYLVGDTGRIVPPGNPPALASSWGELIQCGEGRRRELGSAARRRVREFFSLQETVRQYAELHAASGSATTKNS
jgi:glycosyltransferase involved in cell wall biosynthesis